MQLPAIAIRNHQFTLVIFLLLLLLGVLSFFTMPRSEDPQFDFSAAVIKVVSPGTTPVDVEKLIVDPIEESLNELDDIKKIKTIIEDGLGVIRIEFLFGTDPDEKFDDVESAVGRIRDQLPQSVVALEIDRISPSDVSILQLALVNDAAKQPTDYQQLKKHADALEQKLERAYGVKRVNVEALPSLEVQIQVDQKKVNALGISLDEIFLAIQSASSNIPGGHVNAELRRFTVKTSGDYQSLEQIKRTVVRGVNGKFIYLRDIANVTLTDPLPSYRAKFNGQDAVFISVVQRQGTQIFKVMEGVKNIVSTYQATMPDNLALQTVMDQSASVEKQVGNFFDNLNQGLILVALLTLIVLGLKPALVVVTAIPMSIFIAIGWVDLAGFGLQQMSIVGLLIALGLLVDNAIVVVENVTRHLRHGDSPTKSAISGSSEVAWAVVSGTLTTVLSFFPMLMMQTGSGTFIRAMPVTVVLTLFASLFIALMLTPLLASRLGKSANTKTWAQKKLEGIAAGKYHDLLEKALAKPKSVMVVSVVLLFGALSLFPLIGVSLFPKAEKPMLLVNVEMPEGTPYYQTEKVADEVSEYLSHQELVIDVAENIGRGNPRIYYNTFPDRQTVNFAQLFVTLKEGQLDIVEPFVKQLRHDLNQKAGVKIDVKEFLQGPPITAPINIRVVGEELALIQKVSRDVEEIVKSIDGTVNVNNPVGKNKIDLQVDINRDKAAILGIRLDSIDRTVRSALVGTTMGRYRDDDGEEYPLVLRISQYPTPKMESFDDIKVQTPSGELVPLLQIASLKLETDIARFQRFNMERMAPVTADVKTGYITEDLTNQVVEKLDQYAWPQGVRYVIGGEQAKRKEEFAGMSKIVLMVVFGIFAVLVLQFRSFVQPLIVFAAIPFALIGAFLALFISGYTFSFTAFIGLTSLIGIVVNNSIILVDYANQMRRNGSEKIEAIMESARTRFIPIVLTTLTTIGGLLPLTLTNSSMWSPMGWAIIGGLLVSTVLTLFVVPVLYQWLGVMPSEDD